MSALVIEWSVEWSLTPDAGPVGDAHATLGVVGDGGHLARTPRAVAVLVRAVVARHGVMVSTVDVLTRLGVLQQQHSHCSQHLVVVINTGIVGGLHQLVVVVIITIEFSCNIYNII